MFPRVENGEGLGAGTQLTGGVDTKIGVFSGGETCGVGNTTGEGEGEGVKKISEGDGDGEYEGLSDGESDGDDEKGSKFGGNGKGKCVTNCLTIPWLTCPWILGVLAAFSTWTSCLLYALSPCWPVCLKQLSRANNFKLEL